MNSRLLMALAIGLAGLPAVWIYDQSRAGAQETSEAPAPALGPPAPPLMIVRPLAPAAAIQINREIPFADIPNPPARPFVFRGGAQTYHRALTCLTAAIYYEAGNEPVEGQRAVAQVILNRVRHPAYPASICAVVYQGSTLPTGCQFTFTCDGSLDRQRSTREWATAEAVAAAALAGSVFGPVGNALNYHANFVVPYWASSLAKKAIVGTHIFYRLPGYWGEPRAFARSYSAVEADPIALRATALAARHRRGDTQTSPAAPLISAEIDPRVALLTIVDALASRSLNGETATPIAKAARADFSPFANHLAVEIYRQLASQDEQLMARLLVQIAGLPKKSDDAQLAFLDLIVPGHPSKTGAGLAEALSAFAKDSNFADFFAKQQAQHRSLRDASLASAMPVASDLQNYTGYGVGAIKLVVAPMVQRSFIANCFSPEADMGALVVVAGEDKLATPETSMLLANALARRTLGAGVCSLASQRDCRSDNNRISIVQDQLARQLAARAVQAKFPQVADRISKGPALVVAINEGLKSYEQNRRWFPTFRDYQPVLLQSIASGGRPVRAANRSAAANLQLPASLRKGGGQADPVCDAYRQAKRS